MARNPTLLGTVEDVRGATVGVALDIETASGLTFVDGHGYRVGQVGSFVRIPIGYLDLYGVVSQIGAGAVPERLFEREPFGHRWMSVQLVGEALRVGAFSRGLSVYPTIGDTVHLLAERDLARIYGSAGASNSVRIGRLTGAESIEALVDIDRLVTRHSAVLGATGSGKSTTVARLVDALSEPTRFPSARILIVDVHGEYTGTFADRAAVFSVGALDDAAHPLRIPYWAMSFDELLPFTFGSLDDRDRGAVLEEIVALKAAALTSARRDGVDARSLTVDTPVPFSVHELWFRLHRRMYATHTAQQAEQTEATEALLLGDDGQAVESGDAMAVVAPRYRKLGGDPRAYASASNLSIGRQVDALAARLRDPRLDFLFRPGAWTVQPDGSVEVDLDALLSGWLGGDAPVTVLDLSGVPATILRPLVGALLRIVYDAMFWARNLSEGARERPVLVVLEEAHAYLGRDDRGQAAEAVRRIVREGRKYGIGAMVVSQRPSEVDATILSQCGTIFALRLPNSHDRSYVAGTVSDNLEGLLATLPVLRTGEAIVVGEAVHLPIRMQVDALNEARRPQSSDPRVYDDSGPGGWNRRREPSDFTAVTAAWRSQNTDPRSITKEDQLS